MLTFFGNRCSLAAIQETGFNMKHIECAVADGRAKPTGEGERFHVVKFTDLPLGECGNFVIAQTNSDLTGLMNVSNILHLNG
jgi:hypothetical protein